MVKTELCPGDVGSGRKAGLKDFCLIFAVATLFALPAAAASEQEVFLLATGSKPSPEGLQVTETRRLDLALDPFSKSIPSKSMTSTTSLKPLRNCVYQLDKENRQDGKLVSTQSVIVDFSYATNIQQDVDHATRGKISRFTVSGKDARDKLLCIIADVNPRQVGKCSAAFSNNFADAADYEPVLKAFESVKAACERP